MGQMRRKIKIPLLATTIVGVQKTRRWRFLGLLVAQSRGNFSNPCAQTKLQVDQYPSRKITAPANGGKEERPRPRRNERDGKKGNSKQTAHIKNPRGLGVLPHPDTTSHGRNRDFYATWTSATQEQPIALAARSRSDAALSRRRGSASSKVGQEGELRAPTSASGIPWAL